MSVIEHAVSHRESLRFAIFGDIAISQSSQPRFIRHLHRIAFDHHIESFAHPVGSGVKGAVAIALQIAEFLFGGAGAETDRIVVPDGDQWVTCGRPSSRTVVSQKISADSRISTA